MSCFVFLQREWHTAGVRHTPGSAYLPTTVNRSCHAHSGCPCRAQRPPTLGGTPNFVVGTRAAAGIIDHLSTGTASSRSSMPFLNLTPRP